GGRTTSTPRWASTSRTRTWTSSTPLCTRPRRPNEQAHRWDRGRNTRPRPTHPAPLPHGPLTGPHPPKGPAPSSVDPLSRMAARPAVGLPVDPAHRGVRLRHDRLEHPAGAERQTRPGTGRLVRGADQLRRAVAGGP